MANFKTHYNVGIISGTISSTTAVLLSILTPIQGIFCLFVWMVASISPDIDSPNSKPIKIFFSIIASTLSVLIFFFSLKMISTLECILLSLFTFIAIRYIIPKLFAKLSVHRGIIHSIPFAIVVGFAISIFLYRYFNIQEHLSILAGIFFIGGFLTHLLLDEMYSIDLSGARLKNSFGTAIKLYDKNNFFTSTLIYIILLFEILFLPPFEDFIHTILTLVDISYLKNNFFPYYIS